PVIQVDNLAKAFHRENGTVMPAVDGVSLEDPAGEFVVLLSPSGCGKTTLLRAIAGLESPDGGILRLGGRTVFSARDGVDVPPERRDLSMVFQSYALWPHMTAAQNVAYPLESRRRRAGRDAEVRRALELVGIGDL